jgi:hypothetical protein
MRRAYPVLMRPLLAAAACLTALAFPAGAVAVTCAPPGNSGVDQYFETIPGSSCNVPPPGSGVGSSGGGHGRLAPATSRQLAAQGAVGTAVARFVAATGPSSIVATNSSGAEGRVSGGRRGAHGRGHSSTTSATPITAPTPAAHGRSPIAGVLHPILTGSGSTSGVLLPIFLAVTILVIAATAVLRRRYLARQ